MDYLKSQHLEMNYRILFVDNDAVSANHTTQDVDYFVDVMEKGATKLSIL